jgi:hypothetical protein
MWTILLLSFSSKWITVYSKISEYLTKESTWTHWYKMNLEEIIMFRIFSCIKIMIKMFNSKSLLTLMHLNNIIFFTFIIQKLTICLFIIKRKNLFMLLKRIINLKTISKLSQKWVHFYVPIKYVKFKILIIFKESNISWNKNIYIFKLKVIYAKSIYQTEQESFITLIKWLLIISILYYLENTYFLKQKQIFSIL